MELTWTVRTQHEGRVQTREIVNVVLKDESAVAAHTIKVRRLMNAAICRPQGRTVTLTSRQSMTMATTGRWNALAVGRVGQLNDTEPESELPAPLITLSFAT